VKAQKRSVRSAVLINRKKLNKEIRLHKSKKIFNRLIDISDIKDAKRVMVYVNFQEEVETRDLIEYLWAHDIEVIVPLCEPKLREMKPSLLYSFEELAPGTFGVLEPVKQAIRIIEADTIDVIIVPGLAFDRHGGRIGYGAGYYDRFFEKAPNSALIAIAYDEQVIDNVPMEQHDHRIPLIVTDSEIIDVKYAL